MTTSLGCFSGIRESKEELAPINLHDRLPISEIVKKRPDGRREISATGPEAMRYIFYRAGCEDGSGLAGLLSHTWNPGSQMEEWIGACKSLSYEKVFFRIYPPMSPERYSEFGKKTKPLLDSAENEGNIEKLKIAIQFEPALADARLNLFRHYLEGKKCAQAKRNLDIFLLLSPGFPQRRTMENQFKKYCPGGK